MLHGLKLCQHNRLISTGCPSTLCGFKTYRSESQSLPLPAVLQYSLVTSFVYCPPFLYRSCSCVSSMMRTWPSGRGGSIRLRAVARRSEYSVCSSGFHTEWGILCQFVSSLSCAVGLVMWRTGNCLRRCSLSWRPGGNSRRGSPGEWTEVLLNYSANSPLYVCSNSKPRAVVVFYLTMYTCGVCFC